MEKLGPFNGGQTFVSIPDIVIVSIIGFDWILEIHTWSFGCIAVDTGSYNFNIRDSLSPVQVVIILLLPSPKCNRCVKYFEFSSANTEGFNCLKNPSAILFIAVSLGTFLFDFSKFITISSSLPTNSSVPLILYGVNTNVIELASSWDANFNKSV